jgi:DNA-binding MarR family transcriptional regulator
MNSERWIFGEVRALARPVCAGCAIDSPGRGKRRNSRREFGLFGNSPRELVSAAFPCSITDSRRTLAASDGKEARRRSTVTDPEPGEIRTHFAGVVGALTQLSFTVYRGLEGIAASHDLSLVQGRLLVGLLYRHPTMSEVARLLYLERSSTTGLVMRAEAHGLVEREREGGMTRVRLTPAGRSIAEELEREVMSQLEARCRDLDDGERRLLDELIARLIPRTWIPDPVSDPAFTAS